MSLFSSKRADSPNQRKTRRILGLTKHLEEQRKQKPETFQQEDQIATREREIEAKVVPREALGAYSIPQHIQAWYNSSWSRMIRYYAQHWQ
jgi:hypothetical protein